MRLFSIFTILLSEVACMPDEGCCQLHARPMMDLHASIGIFKEFSTLSLHS